ncbi:MAG: hypothetical protein O2800_00345 [Planctomycetota bacterium]|nr:hypothetical protein [Planctomycetota bacterium]
MIDGRAPRLIAGWALGNTVGADVSIGRLRLEGFEIVAKEVRFNAPLWKGPGAEVARVGTVKIDVDWLSTLMLNPRVAVLTLQDGEFTIVEDGADSSKINLQSLRTVQTQRTPRAATTQAKTLPVDDLFVRGMQCRVATQVGDELVMRETSDASITVVRDHSKPLFWTIAAEMELTGAQVTGAFDGSTGSLSLELNPMAWDRRLEAFFPARARAFLNSASPRGEITQASLVVAPQQPPTFSLQLRDCDASLPALAQSTHWVRLCRGAILPASEFPHLHIAHAHLVVSPTHLALKDLDCHLSSGDANDSTVELPLHASFEVDLGAIPAPTGVDTKGGRSWVDLAMDRAPFSLRLQSTGFRLQSTGPGSCIELPRAAAEFMRRMQIDELAFDLDSTFSRGPILASGESASVESRATLIFRDGAATIPEFPYRLTGLEAVVRFAGLDATIEHLVGKSPHGSNVVLRGSLLGIDGPPAIDLTISCADVALDTTLRAAIAKNIGPVLDQIFDSTSAATLAKKGLISVESEAALLSERAQKTMDALEAACLDPLSTPEQINALTAEAAAADLRLRQGTFEPGGRASFSLHIARTERAEVPVALDGTVRILEANVLLTAFPIPLRASSGVVKIAPDRISLLESIVFNTLAGGHGQLSGSVALVPQPEGGPLAVPSFHFTIDDEPINALLIAAIPPPTGSLVSDLGLVGDLSISGSVTSFGSTPKYEIIATIADGAMVPESASSSIADLGWPRGIAIHDLDARVIINESSVTLDRALGHSCGGTVTAAGVLNGLDRDFEVHGADLSIAQLIPSVLATWPDETLSSWSAQSRPVGRVSGSVSIHGNDAMFRVEPASVEFTLEGEQIRARRTSGSIDAHDGKVNFTDLHLNVTAFEDETPLQVNLHGQFNMDRSRGLDMHIGLTRFSPSSRVGRTLLSLAGARELLPTIDSLDLSTNFDLAAQYADGSMLSATATVHSITFGSRLPAPLALHFDDARVVWAGGALQSTGLHAPIQGGTLTAQLSGDQANDHYSLDFDFDGDGSPALLSLLPDSTRIALEQLDLRPSGRVSSKGASVSVDHGEPTIHIPLEVTDISLRAGIDIAHIAGQVNVAIAAEGWSTSIEADTVCIMGTTTAGATASVRRGMGESDIRIEADIPLGLGTVVTNAIVLPDGGWNVQLDGHRVAWADLIAGWGVHGNAPGIFDGTVALQGRPNTPLAGSGTISLTGGNFGETPPNLLTPTRLGHPEHLTTLEGAFSIQGDELKTDSLELGANSVSLLGTGTLNLDSGIILLRLRGQYKIPILGPLLGFITDPFVQLELSGTLSNSKVRIVPLPTILPVPTNRSKVAS